MGSLVAMVDHALRFALRDRHFRYVDDQLGLLNVAHGPTTLPYCIHPAKRLLGRDTARGCNLITLHPHGNLLPDDFDGIQGNRVFQVAQDLGHLIF